MRISWSLLRRALRDANPKLYLGQGEGKYGAMIYLRHPGSEDCVPGTELEEVMAIASPSFFRGGCPVEDVALGPDDHPSIKPGKKAWVRGAGAVFRRLARMYVDGRRLIDARRVRCLYPKLFRRLDSAKFKRTVMADNAEPVDELRKKAKWLKGRSKPIPGYGMPLGWKPTKIISGGAEHCATPGGLL
jgi:hypothetical protein